MNKETEIVDYEIESIIRPSVQRILTDVFEKTVQFQESAGLGNIIVRVSSGKCCELCTKIAGEYIVGVDDINNAHGTGVSVYFRHNKCDCLVTYHSDKGIQNVHNKDWYSDEEYLTKLQELAQSPSQDGYIREVPLFLGNKGLKYYTEEEINLMAAETKKLVEKYGLRKSKWNGEVFIIPVEDKWFKPWCCKIVSPRNTSPYVLLHEQIHACSCSYFDRYLLKKYKSIEEACVELMASEISKKENIIIVESDYFELTKALRILNNYLKICKDDFSFARKMINMDLPKRLFWLDNEINRQWSKGIISDTDYQLLHQQLDILF